MAALLIGYARCSTDQQDLTAQHDGLTALGVSPARIYVDHGLTGTTRDRPGLREAMAACREGDTLVVTKLDRLARSLPDARAIADELTARQVRLSLGASVYDPNDPVGRLLFNVLAMVAEFESDLIRLRTREGMKVAKAKGRIADRAGRAPASLLGLPVPEWCQQIRRVVHRRSGRLPAATTMTTIRRLLTRMMRLLVTASDTGPWWQRDQWNPVEDNRIPLRDHEPMGRYSVRFDRIGTRWLRRGLQWHCKVGLDTGVLSWSTVHRRIVAVHEFDGFLAGRGVDGPWLADDAAGMRALMLDFLGHLRARPVTRGRRTGQRLSPASVQRLASDVEQFYLFMTDNKDAAAAALAEPGWLRLGPEHTGFYRRGELPGKPRPRLDGQVIDDDAMTRIMGGLDLLGAAVADGGFGDEQAMRITMLVALLGRRVSEICLLDRDPLLPLSPTAPSSPGEPAADRDDQALVAKLRYQQTKIDGAPDTILVHAEVVAIIREQQQWAQRFFAEHGAPGRTPKYLFLAAQMNRNGDRPYSGNTLRNLLTDLAVRLDVRDSTGALVDFNRTHRFRHTVATGLLNTGVPLHVLQRYLGHYAGDLVNRDLSGGRVAESGEQSVEHFLAAELSFLSGVVALRLQPRAEFDGGLEESAGFADRFEVAVQTDGSGAEAVAEHSAVHFDTELSHFGAFGLGRQCARLVVEGFDLFADGEVFVGDGSVGDSGIHEGHPHRSVSQQRGQGFEGHAAV